MTEYGPDAVALPLEGDGSRRTRRASGRPRRRRDRGRTRAERRSQRRRVNALVLGAGVLLGVAGLVAVLVSVLGSDSGSSDGRDVPALLPLPAPASSTGLLLQRGPDGALVAATLLVVDASGRGGGIVYIPTGTMLESASLGLVPLRDVAGQGDGLVRDTLSNLLGTRLDAVVTVDGPGLAAATRSSGPLLVDVPEAVERRVGDQVEMAFPPGRIEVPPERIAELLAAPGRSELTRMVRHQAFWTAWLRDLRDHPAAAPTEATLGPLAGPVARLAAGPVGHQVLPVEAVGGVEELYTVDQRALDRMVTELLPGTPRSAERTIVQVLNGTGRPGAAQDLLAPLVGAGARVAITGNADRFDYAVTQIVYDDDAHAGEARRLRDALGFGEVVKSRTPTGAVDLTVVLGADFPASS